jgi:hypothetical protein
MWHLILHQGDPAGIKLGLNTSQPEKLLWKQAGNTQWKKKYCCQQGTLDDLAANQITT